MLLFNKNVLAVLLQNRSPAISSNPVNEQLSDNTSDHTEENSAYKVDCSGMNQITSVSKHDLAWNDFNH
ncbi:hypothetical protein D3C73_1279990 [compost metagenome]